MSNSENAASIYREAEACLFMMTTLAKRLSFHDPEGRIGSLISSFVLPGLTSKPSASMQEVACILFSELAMWIVLHPEIRQQIVEQLIRIIEASANLTEAQFEVSFTPRRSMNILKFCGIKVLGPVNTEILLILMMLRWNEGLLILRQLPQFHGLNSWNVLHARLETITNFTFVCLQWQLNLPNNPLYIHSIMRLIRMWIDVGFPRV